MSDGIALLRAILSEPADDTARLVLADWLEELGDYRRAEFIRIQIELARGPGHDALRQRESAILGGRTRARCEWALAGCTLPEADESRLDWEWSRGFADVWHCPIELWLEVGPAIARTQPVTRVVTASLAEGELAGPSLFRRSWYRVDESRWANPPDTKAMIPAAIFDLLPADPFDMELFGISNTYPSAECAQSALSDACVDYARIQAGLAPLAPEGRIPLAATKG